MEAEVEKKRKGGKSHDKEKTQKTEKRSSKSGVHKSSHDGKEKKDRAEKLSRVLNAEIDAKGIEATAQPMASESQPKLVVAGALVKFAVPLADEKNTKKIMKVIRKGGAFPSLVSAKLHSDLPFYSIKTKRLEAGSQGGCQNTAQIAASIAI